jgi:hypothetical protein
MLDNDGVRKVTVVSVLQQLTQPQFKYINVQRQVNNCTYFKDPVSVSIQQWVLDIYNVVDLERMCKTLYSFPL